MRTTGFGRRRELVLASGLAAALAVALLSGAGIAPPASAATTSAATTSAATTSAATTAAATTAAAGSTATPGGTPRSITLVTGDVVQVSGAGKTLSASFSAPLEGGQIIHAGDQLYALPPQAMSLLAAGTLDWRLFDVTTLVQDGYTDDKTKQLPVIVDYTTPTGAAHANATRALAGASVTRQLPSIRGLAAQVNHADARRFFAAVTTPAATVPKGTKPANVPLSAAPGITKIWLDGRVKAFDDVSRVTIGADRAQAAGYDGTGVSVAVVDTGVDAAHPDLAGKVLAAQDFVPAGAPGADSPTDRYGHGTHVASIIAGTGVASGGKYAGIAPKATLYNAKVLDDTGSGPDSSVIAGMEWAASKAKVVNMSLGACCTNGTDPLAQAVDSLSASTGALFVIAAGNSGPQQRTVGTPGSASAALTVAATTRDGATVDTRYSSQGLRAGDDALKPEIAAPGTGIVAAAAPGSVLAKQFDPNNTGYMRLSGTSMATPHVAGSAALVLQAHPNWTGQQIKDTLTDTAKPITAPNNSISGQGAGLVNVGTAVTEHLRATGILNLGVAPYPQAAGDRLSGTITYTNGGSTPQTVTLATGTFADDYSNTPWTPPVGAVTLTPAQLTIPAGGSATATISIDAAALPDPLQAHSDAPTMIGGQVTATDTAGDKVATTVSIGRDVPRHTFTLTGQTHDGGTPLLGSEVIACGPVNCWATFPGLPAGTLGAGSGQWVSISGTSVDDIRTSLPAGTYTLVGALIANDPTQSISLAGVSVQLDQNRSVNLDGRQSKQPNVVTDRPTTNYSTDLVIDNIFGVGYGLGFPAPYVLTGPSATYQMMTRRTPFPLVLSTTTGGARLTVDAFLSRATFVPGDASFQSPEIQRALPSSGRVTVVDVGDASPAALAGKDLHGKVALVSEPPSAAGVRLIDTEIASVAQAGAIGVVLAVSDTGPPVRYSFAGQPIWATVISHADGTALLARMAGKPLGMKAVADTSYLYDLTSSGTLPQDLTFVFHNSDLGAIDARYHSPEPGNTDPWANWATDRTWTDATDLNYFDGAMPLPTRRTEYVSPGAQMYRYIIRWQDPVDPAKYLAGPASYVWLLQIPALRPGQTITVDSGRGPLVPGQSGDTPVARAFTSWIVLSDQGVSEPDYVTGGTDPRVLGSSDGRSVFLIGDPNQPPGSTFHTQMFNGTTLICDQPLMLPPSGCLIKQPGQYRVLANFTQTLLPNSTSTSTQWTLNIDHMPTSSTNVADVPLVLAQYQLPINLNGYASRGEQRVPIQIGYQRGDPTAPAGWNAKVWATFDDGKTWHQVYDHRVGPTGSINPQIEPPDDNNGYVGLRVAADDGHGNGIDQTIIRAYTLAKHN